MVSMKSKVQVDRGTLSVVSLHDGHNDDTYWQLRSPAERLQAIQTNRQVAYGTADATGRLQRILEVVKRPHR